MATLGPSIPNLVHGKVMHRRLRPVGNQFAYDAFSLALPLSRLGDLPRLGLAHNRRALVSFFDRDHGARDGSALEPWIRELLAAESVVAEGEIVLYAFPRMLGYVFNPVSFWVCHDRDGAVRAVLCEVCNTFGERHNYLLAHPDGRTLADGESFQSRKAFHVSPFCEVKGDYTFRFHFGPERGSRCGVLRSQGRFTRPVSLPAGAVAGPHRLRRRPGRGSRRAAGDID